MKPSQSAILREGRNCWRVCRSDRAAVLVDAEGYFAHLHEALLLAERSILILGWDFDGRIKLRPQDEDSPTLGAMLRELVEKRPDLQARTGGGAPCDRRSRWTTFWTGVQ